MGTTTAGWTARVLRGLKRGSGARGGGVAAVRVAAAVAATFGVVAWSPGAAAGQLAMGESVADRGRITGRVLDAETGRPLPGAEVIVEATGRRVLAGVDGLFELRDVPVGEQAVLASSLGYASTRVPGLIVGESRTWVEIALKPAAVEVAGVRVRAAREQGSVTAGLTAQRAATAMVSAIGAEQIGRSPDGDAAAAIKRVSGVSVQDGKYVFVRGLGERYTTASLNGARIPSPEPERRVVPLDLFPAGLIETITTSKTFTPDQSGDFSGAQVDMRTRDFPARRKFTVSASVGVNPEIAGETFLSAPGEPGDWLALGADARRIPAAADQFLSASRGHEVNEVVNSFRNVWSARESTGGASGSASISLGGRDQLLGRDLGYLLSGTYSAGQEAAFDQRRALAGAEGTEYNRYDGMAGRETVLWGGLANFSTVLGGHTRVAVNNTYNRSAEREARREEGSDEDTNAALRIDRLRYVERAVRSNQLKVEHQLHADHRLTWSLTSSGVERYEPDRSEFVTWLDPEVPIWFKHEEGAMRSFGGLTEGSWEASVDYRWELGAPANPHAVQVGGLYRSTTRDAESQVFRLQPFHWSATDERWQADPETIFDGRYANSDDSHFLLARDRTGGAYEARDRLAAGYAMATLALGSRVELVGGARIEQSRLTLDYESQLGAQGTVRPEYTDVLPSLALNVDVATEQKVRLSASRTLARPEYREIAPIAYREVLGGEQAIGNVELERTLIQNYDIRWEWYPSYDEALSVGVFAKRFDGPIEQRFLARSGTDTRTFQNAEQAFNYGLEVEVMRNLGAIAAPLSAVSLFANATLMRSEVETGQEEDAPRAMVGQAPYVVNGGLTLAPGGSAFSATLLFNAVGPRIVNARASGSQVEDVIEQPRYSLDFSTRLPVTASISASLDVKNLLDSPYELRQGAVVREYYRTGRSLSLGFGWQPQ